MAKNKKSVNTVPKIIQAYSEKPLRRRLAQQSFKAFLAFYLTRYFSTPFAPFHEEMIHIAEEEERFPLVAVMAFRGAGKSSVLNLGYALWAILGVQKKKCVLIISRTAVQARAHFAAIKEEIEKNAMLKEDLGPFKEDSGDWRGSSLVLSKANAKIIFMTRDQSLRGIRHGPHRPDLIICDDIEDTADFANKDESAKEQFSTRTMERFKREVLNVGSAKLRVIVLGNLLHKRCFMTQMKEFCNEPDEGSRRIFRAYPLYDSAKQCLWPEREGEFSAHKVSYWDQEYLLQNAHGEGSILVFLQGPPDDPVEIKRLEKSCRDKLRESILSVPLQEPLIVAMAMYKIRAPLPVPPDPDYKGIAFRAI